MIFNSFERKREDSVGVYVGLGDTRPLAQNMKYPTLFTPHKISILSCVLWKQSTRISRTKNLIFAFIWAWRKPWHVTGYAPRNLQCLIASQIEKWMSKYRSSSEEPTFGTAKLRTRWINLQEPYYVWLSNPR